MPSCRLSGWPVLIAGIQKELGNLSSDEVLFVYESNDSPGHVWIGTKQGLWKYHDGKLEAMDTQGESWEHIFSYDQYTCIITGKKKSTATLFPITDWRKSLH